MTRTKESREKVKTSITLPRELWAAARHRAIDEGRDLQDVIASAVEVYLKTSLKPREGGKR
jgi:post-segregation antitoxin (ccd killing protein)